MVTHQAPYEIGLDDVGREHFSGGRSLVLFLGSNIGNFDPPGADAMRAPDPGGAARQATAFSSARTS